MYLYFNDLQYVCMNVYIYIYNVYKVDYRGAAAPKKMSKNIELYIYEPNECPSKFSWDSNIFPRTESSELKIRNINILILKKKKNLQITQPFFYSVYKV